LKQTKKMIKKSILKMKNKNLKISIQNLKKHHNTYFINLHLIQVQLQLFVIDLK